MISALFKVGTLYVVVIPFRRFVTDTLSLNVSKELPKHAT